MNDLLIDKNLKYWTNKKWYINDLNNYIKKKIIPF